MYRLIIAMAAVLFAGVQAASADWTSVGGFDYFDKTSYKDRDWNVEFYENCDMPEYHSAQWIEEDGERFLRFTLKNGQVGGCTGDNRARHSAPWWERAEVKQTSGLDRDRNYSLTFCVRFVEGFNNDREGFIQLHQSVKGCRTGALVIVRFSNGVLLGSFPPVGIEDYFGRWVDVRFDFNPSSHFDLYLDGNAVIEGQGTRRPARAQCLPHLKIGIYRPGNDQAPGNSLSVMDIDKIMLVDR